MKWLRRQVADFINATARLCMQAECKEDALMISIVQDDALMLDQRRLQRSLRPQMTVPRQHVARDCAARTSNNASNNMSSNYLYGETLFRLLSESKSTCLPWW